MFGFGYLGIVQYSLYVPIFSRIFPRTGRVSPSLSPETHARGPRAPCVAERSRPSASIRRHRKTSTHAHRRGVEFAAKTVREKMRACFRRLVKKTAHSNRVLQSLSLFSLNDALPKYAGAFSCRRRQGADDGAGAGVRGSVHPPSLHVLPRLLPHEGVCVEPRERERLPESNDTVFGILY